MDKRKIRHICLILLGSIFTLWHFTAAAEVHIIQVLPNTEEDARLEEIILQNIGCEAIDLSGYVIADIQPKSYTLSWYILEHGKTLTLSRIVTKMILNNTDETLYLYDPAGIQIDTFSYISSEKWIPIEHPYAINSSCDHIISETVQTETGNTQDRNNIPPETSSWNNISNSGIHEEVGSGESQMNSGSGVQQENNNTPSNSGNTSYSWTTHTGELLDDDSYPPLVTPPIPRYLSYTDKDSNGKIDTIIIQYDQIITGSILIDSFFLYSRTGGMYSGQINTLSGYIFSWSILTDTLSLSIQEWVEGYEMLSINKTTQSDLRIKTYWNYGIYSIWGLQAEGIFLTTSFSGYTNIIHPIKEEEIQPISETNSWIDPPIPIITLQQPSNATLSGFIFQCIYGLPCRINLHLEESFTWNMNRDDFRCFIITESWGEETCNPSTLYFSGKSTLELQIQSKWNTGSIHSILYQILFEDIHTYGWSSSIPIQNNNGIVTSIISIDWKLPKNQIFTNSTLSCTNSPCSINLTGENSFHSSWKKLSYQWDFWNGNTSSRKDPGAQKYISGNYIITLKVISEDWEQGFSSLSVIVEENAQIPEKNLPPLSIMFSPQKKIGIGNYVSISNYWSGDFNLSWCQISTSSWRKHDIYGIWENTILSPGDTIWYLGIETTLNMYYNGNWKFVCPFWILSGEIVWIMRNEEDTFQPKWYQPIGNYQTNEMWILSWFLLPTEEGMKYSEDVYIQALQAKKLHIGIWKHPLHRLRANDYLNTLYTKIYEENLFNQFWNSSLSEKSKEILIQEYSNFLGDELKDLVKKLPKKKKKQWFIPPQIFLQHHGKNINEQNNSIFCTTKTTCSLNFIFSGSNDYIYSWRMPDGSYFSGKNPKSIQLSPWSYTILGFVTNKFTGEITEMNTQISIAKIQSAIKKRTMKNTKKQTLEPISIFNISEMQGQQKKSIYILYLLLLFLFLFSFQNIWNRKYKNTTWNLLS